MIPFAAAETMRPLLALLLLLATARAGANDVRAAADELRAGVQTIGRPGVPGPLALVGPKAFAVAGATLGDGTVHAVVAATTHGRGRVVAFGHGGYFATATLNAGQTGRLVRNAVSWAARGKTRIGLVGLGELDRFLAKAGFQTRAVDLRALPGALDGFDALCLARADLGGAENEAALRRYVARGGGLVVAGLVWGWKQLNPAKRLARDHRLNALLAPMGLCFADGYTASILPVGGDLARCHAGAALARLAQGKRLPPGEGAQLTSVVMNAYRSLPENGKRFRARVEKLVAGAAATVPTRKRPVREQDARARLALLVRHLEARDLPARKVSAAPSAADFPGAVPRSAPRVTRTVDIDPAVPGWQSTGLYAPPGEVISIELPGGLDLSRYRARIGCHTDVLWGKPKWLRHPEISASFALARKTEIASPHGGLLYVEVARGGKGPRFPAKIRGAVAAPRFVLGRTDPGAWRKEIRGRRAPWAELETSRIILTVRAEDARKLDDPTRLMKFWDEVLGLYAELGMRPLAKRPQRMVPDRQISAGWLHAGYPIMMQLQHSAGVTDLAKLRDGDRSEAPGWGFWHELGHNHQRREWTFAGTTEVTCNLFSLYVGDRIRGIPPVKNPWPRNARERAVAYLAGAPDFSKWKKAPGIALWTYILVQEEFGWEAFQKTFAGYASLPEAERPRSDEEKRDQWLVSLSRAVGRDLGPYFQAWGIPTSPAARASLAGLEPWMPAMVAKAGK